LNVLWKSCFSEKADTMKPIKNILVPLNFSDSSENAIQTAIAMSKASRKSAFTFNKRRKLLC